MILPITQASVTQYSCWWLLLVATFLTTLPEPERFTSNATNPRYSPTGSYSEGAWPTDYGRRSQTMPSNQQTYSSYLDSPASRRGSTGAWRTTDNGRRSTTTPHDQTYAPYRRSPSNGANRRGSWSSQGETPLLDNTKRQQRHQDRTLRSDMRKWTDQAQRWWNGKQEWEKQKPKDLQSRGKKSGQPMVNGVTPTKRTRQQTPPASPMYVDPPGCRPTVNGVTPTKSRTRQQSPPASPMYVDPPGLEALHGKLQHYPTSTTQNKNDPYRFWK